MSRGELCRQTRFWRHNSEVVCFVGFAAKPSATEMPKVTEWGVVEGA
ncbi:hypothetical protein PLANPX_3165 [Lacipirellula parvula]|uniref:Uncharacterized protein n=1 Tax=Lacipirellula parvula TaxID=2650471 RepID=A0A5K7XH53_9BACT|nr:hypothetical protein PLANPX_3165 [Lacipirellula parvula]